MQLTTETTVFFAAVREHSQKPDEFYTLVERLCPAPRYAELFSRQGRDGWDGHGNAHREAVRHGDGAFDAAFTED